MRLRATMTEETFVILCLNCNQPMVLDRKIPVRSGEPDILVWRCDYCRELGTKSEATPRPLRQASQ
jgi:RNase P subunit RPR2